MRIRLCHRPAPRLSIELRFSTTSATLVAAAAPAATPRGLIQRIADGIHRFAERERRQQHERRPAGAQETGEIGPVDDPDDRRGHEPDAERRVDRGASDRRRRRERGRDDHNNDDEPYQHPERRGRAKRVRRGAIGHEWSTDCPRAEPGPLRPQRQLAARGAEPGRSRRRSRTKRAPAPALPASRREAGRASGPCLPATRRSCRSRPGAASSAARVGSGPESRHTRARGRCRSRSPRP